MLNQLHWRFGHISKTRLQALVKSMGVSIIGSSLSPCQVCMVTKATCKAVNYRPAPQASLPLEHMHTNMCRPLPTDHYTTIYLIHTKDEVLASLCYFLDTALANRCCCMLWSDQGGEYMSTVMAKYLFDTGIKHKTIAAYQSTTAWQNASIAPSSTWSAACLITLVWPRHTGARLPSLCAINNCLPTECSLKSDSGTFSQSKTGEHGSSSRIWTCVQAKNSQFTRSAF